MLIGKKSCDHPNVDKKSFIDRKVDFVLRLKQKVVLTDKINEQEYLILLIFFLNIFDKKVIKSFRIGTGLNRFDMKRKRIIIGSDQNVIEKTIPYDIFSIFESYFIVSNKEVGDLIYTKSDSTFNKQISNITHEIFDLKYTINKLKKKCNE